MGQYLPSGTTYPSTVSLLSPGLANGGQDFAVNTISSLAQWSGNTTIVVGQTNHNYSGATTYAVGPASPTKLVVTDIFGGAAGANVTISGVTSAQTFNGAATTAISTAYGSKTLSRVAANTWIAS